MSAAALVTQHPSDAAVHAPENVEQVRRRYESMSLDEMAQSMAESYKQLSEALGNRFSTALSPTDVSALGHAINHDNDDDDEHIVHRTDIDDAVKRAKMNKIFSRAASAGDVTRVKQLLADKTMASFIDINAKDEDGSTPLIYAACFNKIEMARVLLENGANTDIQDSMGWSALMWATTNNHEELVKVLLEHGASAQTKSSKGRTVFDFVKADSQKIGEILASNHRDSIVSESSFAGRLTSSVSSTSSVAGENDFYFQASADGFEHFMAQDSEQRQKLMESVMDMIGHDETEDDALSYGDDEDYSETVGFDWDRCMPDQMFVFGAKDLPRILDTVICQVTLPVASRQELCAPANVVFLSARFAHYFSTPDLLDDVLNGAMKRITQVTQSNARKVHVLAFWITNLTQLLYYLKKDSNLVTATADYQLRLSELVSEIYAALVNDTERRLAKILKPAMLDYEQITGLDDLSFVDEWQRFFRRKSRQSMVLPDIHAATRVKRHGPTFTGQQLISPHDVTKLLSSVFQVLQEYEVHPTVIVQALAQFFHHISCELFNHILSTKRMLSRSKALQIRMNLSHVEDWVRDNQLPSSLVYYLKPFIQLLQLLQCLSQLKDIESFVETVQKFDALNALQIKRCITNYRYEVDEQRISEEIESYAHQIASDTVRYRQARSLERKRQSMAIHMSRAPSMSMSRSDSVPSLTDSVSSYSTTNSPSSQPSTPTLQDAPASFYNDLYDDDAEDDELNETKDPKFMLPFSVPSTAHMATVNGWSPGSSKERLVMPVIPDGWMSKLDGANDAEPQAA